MSILRNVTKLLPPNSRSIFGALNPIFNRVNEKRIKEVGPDRACAEWLMRNGAHIRWKGQSSPVEHYNNLPLDASVKGDFRIEEVIAREASISHHGFDHFKDCCSIIKMTFEDCKYFDDRCLKKLSCLVAESLICLEIRKCPSLCGSALSYIENLKNLQMLILHELEVEGIEDYICALKEALPKCQINPS